MTEFLLKRSALAVAVLATLWLPIMGWAQTTTKEDAKNAKVTTDLLPLTTSPTNTPTQVDGLQKMNLFQQRGGTIAIEALPVDGQDAQTLLQALQAIGLQYGKIYRQTVIGFLPVDKLGELKNIPILKIARPSYRPTKNTGSVTSQGDLALRANTARATYNVSGAGIKVGILSDSYNAQNGAAAGVASGDLPPGVQVLTDYFDADATDEGRAMAEIVHDIAPGSPIAFSTAFVGGEAGFAQNIRGLAAAGCKIITDDVGYFAEPFFQDGLIAQAIDDIVTNNNVAYFTAAGNSGRSSYQSPYNSTSFSDPAYAPGTFMAHNFSGGDTRQTVTIPAGGQIIISFQWDDPFFSVSGAPGARTDMDLLVYFNNIYRPTLSSVDNNIGGDPVEIIGLSNSGSSPVNIELVLVKHAGPDPTLVKWVNFGSTAATEYDTRSSTAIGHENTRLGVSVGAAPWYNTPAFNPALTTAIIEPFSSAGGTPILFDTNGQRIATVVRQKPDITSVDGGNTTFFYADSPSDSDAFPNFFGTSAAAPHAAAVAALMQEKSGNTLSPATITSTLKQTALDMDDPLTPNFDTGFDFRTGSGFIQADAALQAIAGGNTPPTVANVIGPQSATVGQAFTLAIPANTFTDAETPGNLTLTVSGLPEGLTFSGNTISGTPTAPGVSTVIITATDPGSLSVSTTFVLTVSPATVTNTPPTVANVISDRTATVGQPFTFVIPATTFTDAETPGSLTLTVSGLPAGLTFSGNTISGTPTAPGVSTVTVTATDPGGLSVSTTFRLIVNPGGKGINTPPTVVSTIGSVSTVAGQPFSFTIPANTFTDAESPANLVLSVSGLPAGLTFSVNTISGTPTEPGVYTITVTATDISGLSVSTTFTLTVSPSSTITQPFAITGVTTVSCTAVSTSQWTVTFTPLYTGLNGQPVSFSVVGLLPPTTAPGPYTLNLVSKQPSITLRARQNGTAEEASFTYDWLAACTAGSARLTASRDDEPTAKLNVLLYPNPVGDEFTINIKGAKGQTVRIALTDVSGYSIASTSVDVLASEHREQLRFNHQGAGLYLLRVSTDQQAVVLKVIKH